MPEVRRRRHSEGLSIENLTDLPEGIKGDEWNIALLSLLYLLQGIPLGLASAIPLILQNHGASFKQQAEFSFSQWPFSMKLLWAPLVDSLYCRKFGRRKTWLVPAQYLIGFFMVFLSGSVSSWLGYRENGKDEGPQVALLTALFFTLYFLAATQDIAVDGWALTMLKRHNKGYASTCNSVGQTAGYFLGYVVFIALESPDFCNKYLRTEPQPDGMVTLSGFLYFWGLVYIAITTLVAIFKHEAEEISADLPALEAAKHSYKQLMTILKLPSIRLIAFILLTSKIGFAACDGVTSLKLIEGGVPKEKLAILAVPLVPLQIVLPILVSKWSTTERPMNLYVKVFPYRLSFNLVAAFFVYITPLVLVSEDIPAYYYITLLIILSLHQITMTAMFVQAMAFYAVISDPSAGGTYMTLLNTLSNLGGTWTTTVALWLVDPLTQKYCSTVADNDCSESNLVTACEAAEGKCMTHLDGYYLEIGLCTIFGFIWFKWGRNAIRYLQTRPMEEWAIPNNVWNSKMSKSERIFLKVGKQLKQNIKNLYVF
ncbi:acetyl-coenzyme A transporter 1 isoform X2 [Rhodnius prolixus]